MGLPNTPGHLSFGRGAIDLDRSQELVSVRRREWAGWVGDVGTLVQDLDLLVV